MIKKRITCLTAIALSAGAAQAAIVYQDDFSGAGASLNGTTPDISTTGAMWEANIGWKDNGGVAPTAASAAHLDLNIEAGKIYTAQITVLNPDTQWIGFGFTTADFADWTILSNGLRHTNNAVGHAWWLTGNLNGQVAYKGPKAGATLVYSDTLSTANPITLKTVLDNTGPTSIMTFYLNGSQVHQSDFGSMVTSANGGIGLSNSGAIAPGSGSTISGFSLDVSVPEPGSLAIAAIGCITMLRRRRS